MVQRAKELLRKCKWGDFWSTPDNRIVLFANLVFVLTFFLVGPLELYLSNRSEFWFNFTEVAVLLLAIAVLAFLILFIVGMILRGIWKKIYAGLIFGCGIGLYVQGNFLNSTIRQLDGQSVDWMADLPQLAFNGFVWLIVLAFPIVLLLRTQKVGTTICGVLCIMALVMQGTSVVTLALTALPLADGEMQLSTEGEFSLAPQNNIIVFVVDTLDARFFEENIQKDKDYQNLLQDFTYFDNAISGGGPTVYGLPLLLTGSYYEGQDYDDYLAQAFKSTQFYDKMDRKGYDIRLFTTDEFISKDFFDKYIDNAYVASVGISSKLGIISKFYQFVGYKYFPNILKNLCYFYSDEFSAYRTVSAKAGADIDVYNLNDAAFIERYRSSVLQRMDMPGAFRLYHLFGAHGPYTLERDGTTSGKETSLEDQLCAVFGLIADYVEQLKKLGLYEDSTIVITGDHGAYGIYQNPCILIKERGDSAKSLTVKSTPITFQNILPTLSIAVDGENGEDHVTIHEVSENDTVRYQVAHEALVRQFYGGGTWSDAMIFKISGRARNSESIQMIGPVEIKKIAGEYTLGTMIDFTSNGESSQYIFSGISSNHEENGTWLVGNTAKLKMILNEAPQNNLRLKINIESIFNGQQHVALFFNDVCVWNQVQVGNIIDCIIPRNAIADGEQELRFEVTATRPSSVSDSQDERLLSIKLRTLSIVETEMGATVLVPNSDEQYVVGKEILFTEEQDGTQYFTSGISSIETNFAWSLGDSSQIMLMPDKTDCTLEVAIQFSCVFSPPQDVFIYGGDRLLYSGPILSSNASIAFSVPKECIKGGYLFLNFEYPNAVSPKLQGESEDDRVLAVSFESIVLQEVE